MLEAIAGLAGKGLDAWISHQNASKNIKYQKMFAQHGISWKVKDAQAAGLHPLAALGAQTTSYQPVSVGSNFGEAGQDISRALQAQKTQGERNDGVAKQLQALQVQRAGLENQIMASQLRKMNQPGQPPPMPVPENSSRLDGQGDAPHSKLTPQELVKVNPAHPGQEPGAVTDIAWTKNPDGSYSKIPSKEVKDRVEDFKIPQWQWSVRNLATDWSTQPYPAPPGKQWRQNPLTGRHYLVDTPPPRDGRRRIGTYR